MALDWGEARIGVAACDPAGTLAYPLATVRAGRSELDDIASLVIAYQPRYAIVGLPVSLSGTEGPAATRIRSRAGALALRLSTLSTPCAIRLVDERLSTVTASRQLSDAGRSAKKQRLVIDARAAVVILEHALTFEHAQQHPPGELVSASHDTHGPSNQAGEDRDS